MKDVMIIPKVVRLRVEDMSEEESADLFNTARFVGQALEKHYKATSLQFSVQDGPDSGQSVQVSMSHFLYSWNYYIEFDMSCSCCCALKHVHLHILPRRKGDFEEDEIYEKIRNHDKNMVNLRTKDDMAKEASELRTLFYP